LEDRSPVRIAILSDIHGNLEALEAVLADIDRSGTAALYSLGDIVGYGPNPAACIEIVRRRAAVSLIGNHDAAVAGLTALEDFNEFARWAVAWTARHLDAGQIEYLGSLPYTQRAPAGLFVHASPIEPERWHYIHGRADVDENFAAFSERLCFVGHSHRPGIYAFPGGQSVVRHGVREVLLPGQRYLINVGSVGQPRDRDARASYVLYDDAEGSLEMRRVAYPVEKTQERMRAAGIPAFLVDRLGAGV
jgi:diadenosine tetraphosphatase ApaH/serine/threonine PP2A family protein phosphatase